MSMEYQVERKENSIALISVRGRIVGEYQLVPLTEEVDELLEDQYRHIIFDLSQLEFMTSAGLSFFLKTLTRVRHLDGEVILVALNHLLNDLLVTTKLNAVFIIEPDEEAAMHYLKETGAVH